MYFYIHLAVAAQSEETETPLGVETNGHTAPATESPMIVEPPKQLPTTSSFEGFRRIEVKGIGEIPGLGLPLESLDGDLLADARLSSHLPRPVVIPHVKVVSKSRPTRPKISRKDVGVQVDVKTGKNSKIKL